MAANCLSIVVISAAEEPGAVQRHTMKGFASARFAETVQPAAGRVPVEDRRVSRPDPR